MGEFRVLFIDDDIKYNRVYTRQIKEFNKTSELKVQAEIINDYDDGLQAIEKGGYDGAILDLKLSKIDKGKNGDVLARKIKEGMCFPVRIYTAFYDQEEDLYEQNAFYKVHKKTDIEVKDVIKEIADVYDTGITRILGKRGTINDYLVEIFWKHLSGNFSEWIAEGQRNKETERILLRHILSHMQEYLDITKPGEFAKYHPSEVYITPSIKDAIYTGDIIEDSNQETYIVLSPSCDMVVRTKEEGGKTIQYRNAELFLAAEIIPWNQVDEFGNIKAETGDGNQKVKRLKGFMKNKKDRYHFLPPNFSLSASFIDFQKVRTFKTGDAEEKFKALGTVSKQFLKEIRTRFSQYYLRQGQPDLDIEELYSIMKRSIPDES